MLLFEKLPYDVREHCKRVAKYAEKLYGWTLSFSQAVAEIKRMPASS